MKNKERIIEYAKKNDGLLANLTKNEVEIYFNSLKYDQKYLEGESPQEFYNHRGSNDIFCSENDCSIVVFHGSVIGILLSLVYLVKWTNKQRYNVNYDDYYMIKRNLMD